MDGNCYSVHGASLQMTSMYFPYQYFRLIMNRHFFGASSCLPLHILDITIKPGILRSIKQWEVKWTGRIIGDHLFLHGIHRFLYGRGITARMLRKEVDGCRHFICSHVHTCPTSISNGRVTFLDRQSDSDPFIPCQDRLGFCSHCLTDYGLTIELIDERDVSGPWRIVVQSYHQLGSGRSPWDWK